MEKRKISVSTLPNGYALKIDNKDYMYFNMMDLLAGFMVHIGLQDTEYMEKSNILTMLFQTMIGHEWEKNVANLNSRILDMEDRLGRTINHLEQVANTGERLEPRINELDEAIKSLSAIIEKQKADNRQSLMDVRESSQTAKETAVEFKKQSSELKKNINTIDKYAKYISEMKQNADLYTKKLELLERRHENLINKMEKEEKPSKSGKTAKKGGGRKKNDEAVLAEIERQAKENPNIK